MPRIDVVSPEGVAGTIPEEDWGQAQDSGYTRKDIGPPEAPPPPEKYVTGLDVPKPEVLPAKAVNEPGKVVHVINPEGVHGTIPRDQWEDAKSRGYKSVQEEYAKQDTSLPEAALAGFVHASRGLGQYAYEQFTGQQAPDITEGPEKTLETGRTAYDVLHEQHPYVTAAGGIAQDYPLVEIGGVVGGAAAKGLGLGLEGAGLGSRVLGGVVKAGVQGAVMNAPEVAHDIINKDAAGAAEDLAFGAIGNIALHGLFEGAGKVFGAAKGLIEPAEAEFGGKATQEQLNLVAKAMGTTPSNIVKYGDKIPSMLEASGMTAEDFAARDLSKIHALVEGGPKIGAAIKELDTVAEKSSLITESLAKAEAQVKELAPSAFEKEAAKEELGAAKVALKDALSKAESLDDISIAGKAVKAAEHKVESLGKMLPSEKEAVSVLGPILEEVNGTAKKGTFQATQDLTKWTGGRSNYQRLNVDESTRIKQVADGLIRDRVHEAEDAATKLLAARGGDVGKVASALQESRAAYHYSKIFGHAADLQDAKSLPENVLSGLKGSAGRYGIPSIVAGLLGVPHPAIVGLVAGQVSKIAEKSIARNAFNAVRGMANEAAPATQTILKSTQAQTKAILQGAKTVLSGLGPAAKIVAVKGTTSVLKDLIPGGGAGQSHAKQLDLLRSTVNRNLSNPAEFAKSVAPVVDQLHAEGLPKVAEAYSDHQLRLMKVIQAVVPADPAMAKSHPFSANVDVSEIDPATKAKYENILSIANDPLVLLDKIKNNTITPGDVAIAAAINPSTLQRMRDALINEAMKSKPDTTYQQRLSVGIFMGKNIDDSTDQIPVLQSVYESAAPMGAPPAGRGKKGGKLSAPAGKGIADNFLTTAEKSVGHGMQ